MEKVELDNKKNTIVFTSKFKNKEEFLSLRKEFEEEEFIENIELIS